MFGRKEIDPEFKIHIYHGSAGRARNRHVKTSPPNTIPHFFYALPTHTSLFPNLELLAMPPNAITPTAITPTSLTARIHELVSACFTGIWLETCEPEEACREISSLCQTQSWLTCPHD